jgi:hypothetical protein
MSSVILAGTTLGTSLSLTGDTSGELQIQTNNGATTALTLTTGGAAVFTAGTVSAPAITTTGDTNTGIFFPAADTIAFAEGGAESMRITAAGDVGIGQSSPVNIAGYTIQTINNSSTGAGVYLQSNGTTVGRILNTATEMYVGGVSVGSPLIFQSGGIVRMRVNAGAPILCLDGGDTSATGTGIAFPATQSASSDANTLDDYEEGTWTTTVSTTSNITGTPTLSNARYTKIGNLVTLEGTFSAQVTSSNQITYWVFTIPFATAANSSGACGAAKQEANYIVGAVSDSTAGSNNTPYISYSASAALPSGTASHSFSYIYIAA